MSWSLNIGTIAGTAVRVHITFLLFLGLDLRRQLGRGRSGSGVARARLSGPAVRVRGGA